MQRFFVLQNCTVGVVRAVSKWSGVKPGLIWANNHRLLISNPAPLTRITAKAISPTTKLEESRLLLCVLLEDCEFDLRAGSISALDVCQAGASPNTSPVRRERKIEKPNTRASIVAWAGMASMA